MSLLEVERDGQLVCAFAFALYRGIQETLPPDILELYSASSSVGDECDGSQLLNERLMNVFIISGSV
jgi:hypothetical protein